MKKQRPEQQASLPFGAYFHVCPLSCTLIAGFRRDRAVYQS